MRYREPFTVFPRKMRSGKVVWYYQTYNESGRRMTALSTGQVTKSAARAYCRKLDKADDLIPNRAGRMKFSEYSVNWWDDEKCEYVQYRRRGGSINQNYLRSQIHHLNNYILPQFGTMRLKEITRYDVENWVGKLQAMISKKTGRPLICGTNPRFGESLIRICFSAWEKTNQNP
ncbi:MAG: hypothetical protein B6241_14000 [Spirochaetaceae bacterium 4572_59]|nr:MAG: hypothetical protein B6241_14000 [Spirochaetaceae bacterium 4572_59]